MRTHHHLPVPTSPGRPLHPLLLVLALLGGPSVSAQEMPVPAGPWRTLETEHFAVHYPLELEVWTRAVTARLETVHEVVSGLVGSAPRRRVTVVVDDPAGSANGSAWPGPAIFLWPTPPDPRTGTADSRSWGEILSVHEYAHIAHLTRPSRSPWRRLRTRLLPVPLQPLFLTTPRWMIEGYATWIEGVVTGSGRPHGVWRPAVLRQWALEGSLPSYQAMSGSSGFYGGSMAYLAGSAFLEWLLERSGERSLPDLWVRLTGVHQRSFDEAFAGTFGAPPEELYGRFTAELTGQALAVEAILAEAGLAGGDQVQRLDWYTGDPVLSPDGEHLALVLRSKGEPSRLVVWDTSPQLSSPAEEEARRRARERDPDDLPLLEWRPRSKEAVATLYPAAGRGHDHPRWLSDDRLLVVRSEPRADGRLRPDLFLWNWSTGGLERVTRGAAIVEADPTPDGRSAIGIRIQGGRTDLVEVDLADGSVRTLVTGDYDRPFFRPRITPDGRRIVVSRQEGPRWRLYLLDREGGRLRPLGPEDGASRFDAAWMPGGDRLVCVSSLGGILDLELLEVDTGKIRPLTRVTGAAVAPAPDPTGGSVWFLSLTSRGWDLMRLPDMETDIGPVVLTDSVLRPAAAVEPGPGIPLPDREVSAARGYGLGPRRHLLLPSGGFAREGGRWGLTLVQGDPIGRLGLTLDVVAGDPAYWRGASLRLAWRGTVPGLGLEIFDVHSAPVRLSADTWRGGALMLRLDRVHHAGVFRGVLGFAGGELETSGAGGRDRRLAFAGMDLDGIWTPAGLRIDGRLTLDSAWGRTGTGEWVRSLGVLSLAAGPAGGGRIGGTLHYGRLTGTADPFEQFAVGGLDIGLIEPRLLSQRVPLPALPSGFLSGDRLAAYRTEFRTGPVTLWYLGVTTRSTLVGWEKLYGLEFRLREGGIPLLGLPGAEVWLGWAQRVDEPSPRRHRFHLSVTWHP